MSVSLVPLILALPVVALCYPDQWLHQIYVDSQSGVNDPSCWEGGYSTPCNSLNMALKEAQHHYNHSTIVHLQPGQHQLHSGSETVLRNMSQLAIVGNGSQGEVVIKCEPLAGLAFSWSDEIKIANVSMIECGVVKNSTSQISTSILVFQVAILFINSKNIQLTNVRINRSNGTGVVVYNPVGVVNITSCLFSHNGVSGDQEAIYGGGGLVIEVNEAIPQSSCIVTNSTFTHNTASSGQYSYLSPTTNPSGYFGLGRGGGISVVFRGGAVNNSVQLDGVHLVSNVAQFGGGLYLAFYDSTSDNTVSMVDSEVTGNEAWFHETGSQQTHTSGGGVFIGLAGNNKQCYPSDNKVNINNSTISLNSANSGGGVCVDLWQYNDNSVITAGNKLLIENCAFNGNEATLGSSAYLTQNSEVRPSIMDTIVYSSNFTSGHCVQKLTNGFGLQCNGSVLLVSSTLTLKGIVVFADNSVSALSLRSSSIQLSPSTEVQFTNNSAMNGGALHLADCSFIVVNNGSAFFFEKNLAMYQGGAIYAESCTCNSGQSAGNDCIIRHSNSTLHPNDWRMSATFTENKALHGGDSVYIDTIELCIWQQSNENPPASTLCWQGWTYRNSSGVEENCTYQLRSAPAFITTTDQYTIRPGGVVSVSVRDAWGNDITSDTTVQFDVVKGSAYLLCSTVVCEFASHVFPMDVFHMVVDPICIPVPNSSTCAPPVSSISVQPQCVNDYSNHSVLLYISTLHQRTGIFVEIHFTQCEQNRHQPCNNQVKPLQCHSPTSQPACIGMIIALTMLHGSCPLSYISITSSTDPPCALHREGTLCGKCADGYGVAINHPDLVCTECAYIGAVYYLIVGLVPVLVMMIVLSFLHINTNNGYLSGFILYSQIVTLQFPGMGYSPLMPNCGASMQHNYQALHIPLIVYSMWNLNFLTLDPIPFCIPYVDTAVRAIALQYCIAVCPLLFIAVTYLWIRCYDNGYRPVVFITRPVHQLLARCFWQYFKIRRSLIDTYAGLIILSYMRFLATSVKLLQFTPVYDKGKSQFSHLAFYYDANLPYFGWPHAAYGVLAIVCLLMFVVPPPVVLLFYHLQCFQRCLTRCKLDRPGLHALVDACQGCFKNSATDQGCERRYFAGIFLLFRVLYVFSFFTLGDKSLVAFLLPITVGVFTSFVLAAMIVILRPYKKPMHNFINCLLFFYMFLISEVSVINFIPLPNVKNIYFDVSSVLYIPFLVLCLYFIYQLCKLCIKHVQKRRNVVENRLHDESDAATDAEQAPLLVPVMNVAMGNCEYVADDLYADRILNPGGYNKQHVHYQPLENSTQ